MEILAILFGIALFMWATQLIIGTFRGLDADNINIIRAVGPQGVFDVLLGKTKDPDDPHNCRGLVAHKGRFHSQSAISRKALRSATKERSSY